jgi:hypothetical protein
MLCEKENNREAGLHKADDQTNRRAPRIGSLTCSHGNRQ